MFGLQTLDIAIGLIFIYLLLALICTAANEFLAGMFDTRAKNLRTGIRNLLEDPTIVLTDPVDQQQKGLVDLFYVHPLIKALYEDRTKPSYIPSRTFALAVLDILAPLDPRTGGRQNIRDAVNALPSQSDVRKTLLIWIDEASGNLDKVRDNLETWFNDGMERVAGWYKQKTQRVILGLAIFVTALSNADTVQIAQSLSKDPALRAVLVAQAQELAKNPPQQLPPRSVTPAPTSSNPDSLVPSSAASSDSVTGRAVSASLSDSTSAGTTMTTLTRTVEKLEQLSIPLGWSEVPQGGKAWLTKIVGLLLTALAVSLGAPFWFDMLNKVINVRAIGKSPKELSKAST